MIIAHLDTALTINDLWVYSFRLHSLKGDRQGYWSITVRANWRIIFSTLEIIICAFLAENNFVKVLIQFIWARFKDGSAFDVELIDYH